MAYAAETRTRIDRVKQAQPNIKQAFGGSKQQDFIDFILERYVEDGVQELSAKKMRTLIELKYGY